MKHRPELLFVCTANICRSPWAEYRTRTLMGDYFDVSSAGVLGLDGHAMDPVMASTLSIPTTRHSARSLTYQIIDRADLILTMEGSHRVTISHEFPAAISKTFTLGQFAKTLQSAPRRLSFPDLIGWVYRNRVNPSRSTDVSDPYGKGLTSAQECAELLEKLIQSIAPPLLKAQQRQFL